MYYIIQFNTMIIKEYLSTEVHTFLFIITYGQVHPSTVLLFLNFFSSGIFAKTGQLNQHFILMDSHLNLNYIL